MKRYCVNCGLEVKENFCPNCGTKVDNSVNSGINITNQVFVNDSRGFVSSNNKYNLYKSIVGGIMIFFGFYIFAFSFYKDQMHLYEIVGCNIMLAFTIPGLLALVGGILSVASKKNNALLLYSGIMYFFVAIVNMCGISDVSPLFIMSCVFGILNIVFFNKTR